MSDRLRGYDGPLSYAFDVLDVKLVFFSTKPIFFFTPFDNAVKQMAKKYFYKRCFTVRSQESQRIQT